MKSPKKEGKKKKINAKDFPTLNLFNEREIAMDFAAKIYKKFDKIIKSIILFGSTIKKTNVSNSDIDIIIIIDDASIKFDQETIAWYRDELGKIISENPYKQELHINSVRLTTWWQDMLRGDPVVINVIRYGEAIIDFGGFFNPLKFLLQEGKIKPTPESVYTCLQRASQHLIRSRQAELSSIEGIFWALVDSSHALIMSAKIVPPSPEHIPQILRENFVSKKMLGEEHVSFYLDIFNLHKGITHGDIRELGGRDIEKMQDKADKFIKKMADLIEETIR